MARYYETHYRLGGAALLTTGRWNEVLEHVDARLDAAERHAADVTSNPHNVTASSVGRVVVPRPVLFRIGGDDDPDTRVHFQLQVSASVNFATLLVDVESKDDPTGWWYNNGSQLVAVPSGGVEAWWAWERDDYGTMQRVPRGYAGYNALYVLPATSGVLTETVYYYRVRQWDGTEYSATWEAGSFRT